MNTEGHGERQSNLNPLLLYPCLSVFIRGQFRSYSEASAALKVALGRMASLALARSGR